MASVSVSDMHNFVENMDSGISLSRDVGNVIDIGNIEELGNDLGAGLLSNARTSPKTPSFSMGFSKEPAINILEPMEAISFDIPETSQPMPDISVNRESPPDMFSNDQTATGPSLNLMDASRLSPEEEPAVMEIVAP